ncbi:MAG: ribonuclease P protein component [Propionibacteriaceae bacterium]|jgi:ribonuclease P protein component|nr:ribonuclease P protein component [Propionibacteriaceae bacterium]
MLPRGLRLRRSTDFASVIRHGRKVATMTLVLYAQPGDQPGFGVVVGKRVGPAVVRNRVKRQLRHQARPLMEHSDHLRVVVRALPGAGVAGSRLGEDLTNAWDKAARLLNRDRADGARDDSARRIDDRAGHDSPASPIKPVDDRAGGRGTEQL